MEIHIVKGKEPIDGSPLLVHAFDPNAVALLDFPKKIFTNTFNRFTLDPTKAGKGSLKIVIRGEFTICYPFVYHRFVIDVNNRALPITVLKQSNGHVGVEFQPTHSGNFILRSLPRSTCRNSDLQVYIPSSSYSIELQYQQHHCEYLQNRKQPKKRLNQVHTNPLELVDNEIFHR